MNTFSQQVEAIRKKYEKKMALVHKKASLDMFKRVIMKTPVDLGVARGNWMLGINHIPQEYDINKKDKKGSRTLNLVVTGLSSLKLGDTAVLANSVPYIGALEYERRSKQTPEGMVRTTVEEYKPTLERAVRKVERKFS